MDRQPAVGLQELVRARCDEVAARLGQLEQEPIEVEPMRRTHPADHSDAFVPDAVRWHQIVRCEAQLRVLRPRIVQLGSSTPIVCVDCTQPIDADRLRLVPDATRCVHCLRERERAQQYRDKRRIAYL
jgi:RNA polymerase-binding transcription factor DksA